MGKEPKHVDKVKIERIIVNHSMMDEVYIDLEHVNFGSSNKTGMLNRKQRSDFTPEEVVEFVKKMDRNVYAVVEDVGGYLYYEVLLPIREKKREYRLVYCVEKIRPNIICVITLYCTGKI